MPSIPAGVILIWAGANAAIPAGWERETTLDGRFPKAANDAEPNVTGGNATHTHTSPSHTHTLNAHTHTYTLSTTTAGNYSDNTNNAIVYTTILRNNHFHTGTSGAAVGGTTQATAVTYGAFSNDPPFYSPIFIRSTGVSDGVPDDVIALFNDATPPTSWEICDGDLGTPDLRNKYLKGAATDADAGATGGSTTNSHDITHTHTVNNHTHAAANSGGPQGHESKDGFTDQTIDSISTSHVHSVSLLDASQPINANADTLVTAETVEPAHKKLIAIQNQTGAEDKPIGVIGMWLGSVADVPPGWAVCDGDQGTPDLRDKFIKIANTTGEIGDTGGSNTHTHAAQSHSHTSPAGHTHSVPQQNHVAESQRGGNGAPPANITNVHAASTSASTTATYAAANTTADSANNEPLYRTVLYIQYIVETNSFTRPLQYRIKVAQQVTKELRYRVGVKNQVSLPLTYKVKRVWQDLYQPNIY